MHPSKYELWYGRDQEPAGTRILRAGPLTMLLDGADIRYVRLGDVEVVRRVYIALRDGNWDTLPGTMTVVSSEISHDAFDITFRMDYDVRDVAASWIGRLTGECDGTITYTMDGEARSDFLYNRFGFCVLHPADAAGQAYNASTPAGDIAGHFPKLVAPQAMVDGKLLGLMAAFSRLQLSGQNADGRDMPEIDFTFEGDLFETEDQRNWTDASFKTYCRPLSLPFPVAARKGEKFHQRITIRVDTTSYVAPAQTAADGPVVLRKVGSRKDTLPSIGLGYSAAVDITPEQIDLLRELDPAHLRVDLKLGNSNFATHLNSCDRLAKDLGAGIEAALFVGSGFKTQLTAFVKLWKTTSRSELKRILLFDDRSQTTPSTLIDAAKELLRAHLPGVEIVAGTNVYLCEINRAREGLEKADGITFSINPQVHAFDEMSLVETLPMQAVAVETIRSFAGDLPIHASPVTLRPRFNAVATKTAAESSNELPYSVDARQMSLFGAAWTLGSIKYLSEAGAASATYYEAVGWRGVMELTEWTPFPQFPSLPGMVFPLYHVLTDIAECRGGQVILLDSQDALRVIGFGAVMEDKDYLFLANMSPCTQSVELHELAGQAVNVRRLNADTALLAIGEPVAFRQTSHMEPVIQGVYATSLQPFEYVRLQVSSHIEALAH